MGREIKFRWWNGVDMVANENMTLLVKNLMKGGDAEFMQYTGIKDSQGVEIYIGDILEMPVSGTYQVIEFLQGEYYTKFVKRANTGQVFDFGTSMGQSVRVVGNIHENPELVI